jgi:hypothetical protein
VTGAQSCEYCINSQYDCAGIKTSLCHLLCLFLIHTISLSLANFVGAAARRMPGASSRYPLKAKWYYLIYNPIFKICQ